MLASLLASLLLSEGLLRLKNRDMKNYAIEMWRYSLLLKRKSENPILGHEHVANAHAVLQNVEVRLNELGLRSGPINGNNRPILVLGSSVALGWGVQEDETLAVKMEQALRADSPDIQVLNAGVGNYNASRFTELFFDRLQNLKPSKIVIVGFLRDAEQLRDDDAGFLLRHSQLAVSVWNLWKNLSGGGSIADLVRHYREVYRPGSEGLAAMKTSLERLGKYGKDRRVPIYYLLMPDLHQLNEYPFRPEHEQIATIATEAGMEFIDLLPEFAGHRLEDLRVMPGDPHPGALGQKLALDALLRRMKN